jgi:hypothetical protein
MGRVITHCQTQKINISEGKVLKSQQVLKFNHLVIGYHWTVISWAVFADSLWANLMMGKSTLLQSVFVILLWFGKVIFLPFMEKNQTADWSGWCRCMTFFHHLPKFQTMGLQISDHGLHKHSDFQQQNCRKTQIFRKWIASEKTHLQWSLSESQNVSQSQIFVPMRERETREQQSHNRKGAAHLPTVPSNIPLVLFFTGTFRTSANPKTKNCQPIFLYCTERAVNRMGPVY